MRILATATLLILLLTLAPTQTQAQSISFAVGASAPEIFANPRLWYSADFRFFDRGNMAVEAEAGYWSLSRSEDFCPRLGNSCAHSKYYTRDLSAGLSILYVMSGSRLGLSFGGGAGAHFMRQEFSSAAKGPGNFIESSEVDSSVEPDAHLVGSLDIVVSSHFGLFLGQRTEFIRHVPDEWKAFCGIRFLF